MINIIFITLLIYRSFYYLHMYQLMHYNNKEFLSFVNKNFLKIKFFKFNPKVKFRITMRMKRFLILLATAFMTIFILNISMIVFFLSGYLICLVGILIYPLENLFHKNHKKRAMKKLKKAKLIKIGITGSYGKTSVKNYITNILSVAHNTLKTPKSFNTPMGISRVINDNNLEVYEYFVCEMGARKVNEIKELTNIVKQDIAVITEIGPQHIETFKTVKNIVKTKFEIINEDVKVAFLNYDNTHIKNYKNKFNTEIISFGNSEEYNYNFKNVKVDTDTMVFDIYKKNNFLITINTKLLGKHNIYNILVSVAISDYLDLSMKDINRGIARIKSVANRLEVKKIDDYILIDDSFNSNVEGFKNALDVLNLYKTKKIIITPGLVELGAMERQINEILGSKINQICDVCILVSNNGKLLEKYINKEKVILKNTFKEAFSYFQTLKYEKTLLIENDLPDNY